MSHSAKSLPGLSSISNLPGHGKELCNLPIDCNMESNSKRPKYESLKDAEFKCIQDVLRARANSAVTRFLLFYPLGSTTSSAPIQVSYRTLYTRAERNSQKLAMLAGFNHAKPVVLQLEDQYDAILWFWAVVLAHGIPVMSSPLSNIEESRIKYLQGLSQLLESPICITRKASLPLFENGAHTLRLHTLESMEALAKETNKASNIYASSHAVANAGAGYVADPHQLAGLMLTSGSTGNAKAVRLRHGQILAAVAGKMSMRSLPAEGAFLNWIGMDHVAALVETHLTALWLNLDQAHIHAADVIASPSLFMELLSRHRVSRTFAPNFFLAHLVTSRAKPPSTSKGWDLSNLKSLISGGEANDIETVIAATALLGHFGAPSNVIQPGFGMTETCAGAIYNVDCPSCDLRAGKQVASLGRCMPGIEMRMVDSTGRPMTPNEPGYLEVRGTVVFDGYYRDPRATAEAFVSGDGWFRTGDRAVIDTDGIMAMLGRTKDVFNINGVKIVAADVQAALESALRGTCVNRIITFPSRASGAATEQITVAYVPREGPLEAKDMADIDSRIVQACMMVSMAGRPCIFVVRERSLPLLPLSSLGKISGAKMRALFEANTFDDGVAYHRQLVDVVWRQKQQITTHMDATEDEEVLRADFAEIKGLHLESVGIDAPIFELGFSSLDLIRLKHRISNRLGITVTVIILMKNPTVRALANALNQNKLASTPPSSPMDARKVDGDYDPVVVLRRGNTKKPLWLIHPGVGEVLVFVGLAHHLRADDRPIYALRARGFEPNQHNFTCIAEAVSIYAAAIRCQQPEGPYAIAGYSYGAMLAFETAKMLENSGETVGFLGSFNLPPHIKHRMRQLTWNMCLLHLGQFLGLIEERIASETAEHDTTYCNMSQAAALEYVLGLADAERVRDLGLDEAALLRWADVAYGLQSMAVDYEPTGCVSAIDVFHAEPLRIAAASRDEWVSRHLNCWREFCWTEPRFHTVGGGHYTMIGPDHVASFAMVLRAALEERGL